MIRDFSVLEAVQAELLSRRAAVLAFITLLTALETLTTMWAVGFATIVIVGGRGLEGKESPIAAILSLAVVAVVVASVAAVLFWVFLWRRRRASLFYRLSRFVLVGEAFGLVLMAVFFRSDVVLAVGLAGIGVVSGAGVVFTEMEGTGEL